MSCCVYTNKTPRRYLKIRELAARRYSQCAPARRKLTNLLSSAKFLASASALCVPSSPTQIRTNTFGEVMQTLWQYLRYAERMLAKKSCFTLIAVIMLTLGVCANSSVFSSVNALLFKQTPAAVTASQSRQPAGGKMSPEAWPPGELEKYWQLQITTNWPNPAVEGSKGMVAVTTEAFAARVGLEALRQGGSAADAALATALTQIALTAGSLISYAGVLTMVYYDAASKKVYSLNAGYNTVLEEKEPLTIPGIGMPSGRTVLVPGFLDGVQAAHDRFGKLPFASLFGEAIEVADKGFNLYGSLGRRIDYQKSVLTRLPETKREFTRENGDLYKAGDLFRQPQLAETLRKVAAQGTDYIYQGEWAKRFVAAVQSEGRSEEHTSELQSLRHLVCRLLL